MKEPDHHNKSECEEPLTEHEIGLMADALLLHAARLLADLPEGERREFLLQRAFGVEVRRTEH